MEKESLDQMRARLLGAFKCPKCKHAEARAKTVTMPGGGVLGAILGANTNQFLCVICASCRFTEWYETDLSWGS